MNRLIYKNLLKWKNSPTRKPLLLQGARQVGKTYILETFGKKEFSKHYLFNFEKNKNLNLIFDKDLNPERIISELSISSGKRIDINTDLVIFDEIQECPRAINSLKYFCEDMPKLSLCSAGSHIGVKLSSDPFPVGKIEFLQLYPMNFQEFLNATEESMLIEIFESFNKEKIIPEIAHIKLMDILKEYYITGGMPQVVSTYLSSRNNKVEAIKNVRSLQRDLMESYTKDFAKHAGKINSMHIISVLENIPMQLSKNIDGSIKRYQFKGVIPKKKSFPELQGPIDWLEKAGLVIKVKVCNRSELPLEAFCKNNMFKLLLFDIGLLGSMLDLPYNSILSQDYGIIKGYFAENYVAQELVASGVSKLYSWTERNSEIEFLQSIDGKIVPIEVKAGTKTQAKSLKQYIIKYSPEKTIKISGKPLEIKNNTLMNYPLYLAGKIFV